MKQTLSVFVDRLEKMLDKCTPATIDTRCPGAPNYSGGVTANYLLDVDDEWCLMCRDFMGISTGPYCPCQVYIDDAYDVAVDRVKEYRASERGK